MGLPGSGKTYFANKLKSALECKNVTVDWINADDVRKENNDWDFSYEGRIRQSKRMSDLATQSTKKYVICDFIAPLPEVRKIFNADFIIFMDTIQHGRYEDTNQMFMPPLYYDFKIQEKNSDFHAKKIAEEILKWQ